MQIQNLPRKACCGAIGVANCFKPMNLPKPDQFSPCIFDIIRPKNNSNKKANFLLKPKTYMYILTNTDQIPFNISNESVLFLDNSLVMHSVKISFLLQPDKGLFCLSVEDKSFIIGLINCTGKGERERCLTQEHNTCKMTPIRLKPELVTKSRAQCADPLSHHNCLRNTYMTWCTLVCVTYMYMCRSVTYSAASLNLFTSWRRCVTRSSSCWFLLKKISKPF